MKCFTCNLFIKTLFIVFYYFFFYLSLFTYIFLLVRRDAQSINLCCIVSHIDTIKRVHLVVGSSVMVTVFLLFVTILKEPTTKISSVIVIVIVGRYVHR
jgi:hypothetical protein